MLHPNNHVGFCKYEVGQEWQTLSDEDFLSYAGCILTGTSSIERADFLYHLDNVYDINKVKKELGIVYYAPDGRLETSQTKKIYSELFNNPETRPILEKLDQLIDPQNKLK